jgi:hypothetical protein
MSTEKVDIKKFAQGFIQPVEWWKAASTGLKILAVLFAVFVIYRAFFMKTQTQSQNARIIALPGSTVTYAPQQQQKQETKKRPWWLPVFFLEGYGFSETTGVGNSRTGVGGRVGGRLEW